MKPEREGAKDEREAGKGGFCEREFYLLLRECKEVGIQRGKDEKERIGERARISSKVRD